MVFGVDQVLRASVRIHESLILLRGLIRRDQRGEDARREVPSQAVDSVLSLEFVVGRIGESFGGETMFERERLVIEGEEGGHLLEVVVVAVGALDVLEVLGRERLIGLFGQEGGEDHLLHFLGGDGRQALLVQQVAVHLGVEEHLLGQ